MSDTPTPAAPAPTGSDQPTAPAAPVVPEGYVPQAEVDQAREEARRRYQSEKDTLEAEVRRLKAAPAPAAGAIEDKDKGFDPESFRLQMLRDVAGTLSLTTAASELKAQFPHADPSLFTPEKLSTFASTDALRFAAEDSHRRVAGILDAERAAMEAKLREELAAATSGASGASGTATPPPGDPSLETLSGMTLAEIDALEAANPGVVERVMRTAGAAA